MKADKELIIDVKDFIAFLLKKWLLFVIATVICAIAFGSYKTISFMQSAEDAYSEKTKANITKDLTNIEINEIDNLFSRYLAYKNRIKYSESYLGKSILMRMDPTRLPSLTVQYCISSDQHDLITSFTSMSLGNDEYKKIAAVFGDDTDSSVVSEVASVYSTATETDGISLDLVDQNSILVGGINNTYKWMLSLNAYAFDTAQCEAIMEIIETAVNEEYQRLTKAGITVTMDRVGSIYTENSSNWLADHQRTKISESSTLKSEYDNFEKNELSKLSSEEKRYFTFLKDKHEGKEKQGHFLRHYAVGGIAGLGLVFVILTACYFLSNSIKSKDEYLVHFSEDNLISIIYTPQKRRGLINKLINRIINKICYGIDKNYSDLEKATITAQRIKMICSRNKIEELYIVEDSPKTKNSMILDHIVEILSQNITVHRGTPLMTSKDLLEFEQVKPVVYYGGLHSSSKESLSDYVKLFKENSSVLLGGILSASI